MKTAQEPCFSFHKLLIGRISFSCLLLARLSKLVWCNTLVYWAHSQVTNIMKGCEYSPRSHLCNLQIGTMSDKTFHHSIIKNSSLLDPLSSYEYNEVLWKRPQVCCSTVAALVPCSPMQTWVLSNYFSIATIIIRPDAIIQKNRQLWRFFFNRH